MPYNESEIEGRIREIRNSAEPVLNGITNKLEYFEVSEEDFYWLLEQAEKVSEIEEDGK